jgi:hypothetical protein
MRYFNIPVPCSSTKHYTINVSTCLRGVEQMIDMEQVIRSINQMEKTRSAV